MLTQIYNAQILTPSGWAKGASLVFNGNKIVETTTDSRLIPDAHAVDAQGDYLVPGFIELHCHGGGGCDFRLATPEAFQTAVESHLNHGTTSIYPTVSASPASVLCQAADTCEQLMQRNPDSPILGLHFEGNYLSPAKAGAQQPGVLQLPSPELYMPMLERYSCLKRWDAAPELPGALEFGRACRAHGVLPSIAHTNANMEQTMAAFDAGYTHVTHFYNATPTFHNRGEYKEAGVVEAAYLIDDMTIECIADGIHVPPLMLRMANKIKGTDRMALVTDGLACSAGNSTETYDPRFVIHDGVCKLSDHSALAGSIATMDRLVRTAVLLAGIPLEQAVAMVTATPARIMNIQDRKGALAAGKDADMVLLSRELQVQRVWQGGKEVVCRPNQHPKA